MSTQYSSTHYSDIYSNPPCVLWYYIFLYNINIKLWLLSSTSVNGGDIGIELYEVTYSIFKSRPYLFTNTETFGWPKPCVVPEAHQVYKCSGLHHTCHTCNCAYYISHNDIFTPVIAMIMFTIGMLLALAYIIYVSIVHSLLLFLVFLVWITL